VGLLLPICPRTRLLKKSLKKAAQSVEGWGRTRIEQASKERNKIISMEAKAAKSSNKLESLEAILDFYRIDLNDIMITHILQFFFSAT